MESKKSKGGVIGEGAVTIVCAKDSTHTNLPYIKSDEAKRNYDSRRRVFN